MFYIGVCGKTLDMLHLMVPCKTKSSPESVLSGAFKKWHATLFIFFTACGNTRLMTSPTPKHRQVQPQIGITALGNFGATSGKFRDFR